MSGLKRRFTPYTVEDKIPTNFQSFQVYFAYPAMLVIWIVALVWMPEKLNGSVPGPLIDVALCILVTLLAQELENAGILCRFASSNLEPGVPSLFRKAGHRHGKEPRGGDI